MTTDDGRLPPLLEHQPVARVPWRPVLMAGVALCEQRDRSGSGRRSSTPSCLVVALHAGWDGLRSRMLETLPFGVGLSVATIAISALGLAVLAVVFRWTRRQERQLEAEGAMSPPVTG